MLETVAAFIKTNGLEKDFSINIENNHATLAGHTFWHDLQVAVDNGLLGSGGRQPGGLPERLGHRSVSHQRL